MKGDFITVDAHEVNLGDVLAGVAGARDREVGSILWTECLHQDGGFRFAWIFGDERGREIDRRPLGARVQVVRAGV